MNPRSKKECVKRGSSCISPYVIKAKPNKELIKNIESILEMAKTGEVQAIAGVISYSEKRCGFFYNICDRFSTMILLAEIELLKRDFIANNIDDGQF